MKISDPDHWILADLYPKNGSASNTRADKFTLIRCLQVYIFISVFRIPMSLNADPDPGFHLNADPDPDTDPDSGFWILI